MRSYVDDMDRKEDHELPSGARFGTPRQQRIGIGMPDFKTCPRGTKEFEDSPMNGARGEQTDPIPKDAARDREDGMRKGMSRIDKQIRQDPALIKGIQNPASVCLGSKLSASCAARCAPLRLCVPLRDL
jgi:hypothetical protein